MNSNHNIDRYFNQAKKTENPDAFFSNDEIRSITEKGYSGANSNILTRIWKILKRKKIMSISIVTIVSSLIWFTFVLNETEKMAEEAAKAVGQTMTGVGETVKGMGQVLNGVGQAMNAVGEVMSAVTGASNSNKDEKSDEELNEQIRQSIVNGYEDILHDENAYPLLKLTDEELEQLGFKKVGLNYEFITEQTMVDKTYGPYYEEVVGAGYDINDEESLIRAKHLLDTITAHRAVIPNENFTIHRASNIIPYAYMSNNDSKYSYGDLKEVVYQFNPKLKARYGFILTFQLRDYYKSNWGFRDYSYQDKRYLEIDKNEYFFMTKLVPVFLHVGDKNAGTDAVFWFVPTKEFLNAIPDRYKFIVATKYDIVEKFEYPEEITKYNPANSLEDETKLSFLIPNDNPEVQVKIVFYPDDEWVRDLPKVQEIKKQKIKIGNVALTVEDMRKIRFKLKRSIDKYNPPSIDILALENDSLKFERLLKEAIDRAAPDQYEIGKIQLYGFICELFAYDIQGIEEIELNDKELEKLNIFRDSVGYYALRDVRIDPNVDQQAESFFKTNTLFDGFDTKYSKIALMGPSKDMLQDLGYETTNRNTYYRNKVVLYREKFTQTPIKYEGWGMENYLNVQTVGFVSNGYFEKQGKTFTNSFANVFPNSPLFREADSLYNELDWEENSFETSINKLIPIKMGYYDVIDSDSVKWLSKEFIMWYVLNEDLINALPERYHESLKHELRLMTAVEEGELPAEAACKQMEEKESYLDICRYESANIKDVEIFPNPSPNKEFNIKLNVINDCNIRFDVHEVTGRFVGNIQNIHANAGENTFILEVTEMVSNGVYLLSIRTDKGEQVVRRIIFE